MIEYSEDKECVDVKCKEIDRHLLNEFVCAHPMANHIKTAAYGEVERKRNESILLLGFFVHEELVATAMILVHRNLFGTHWYIPGGVCVDMLNLELAKSVYQLLRTEAEKAKVIYVRVDPDVQRLKHHSDGTVDETGFNHHYITEAMQSWGFSHLGYNYGYSGNVQSRYTLMLQIEDSLDSLIDRMHASNRSFHRKNQKRGVVTQIEGKDKLHLLHRFAKELAVRQYFIPKSIKQFEQLLDEYGNRATYFVSYVDMSRALSSIASEIEETEALIVALDPTVKRSKGAIKEAHRTLESLLTEQIVYSQYKQEHGERVPIGAAIFAHCGYTSYDLYLYTTKTISSLRPAIDLHISAIKHMKDLGVTHYDFVGISGSTDPSDSYYGLFDFKRRFGGDFIEYLGEFDLIINQKRRDLSIKAHNLRRRIERKIVREYFLRLRKRNHD
jgi:peptidoglycan pentaglycine glycine transferase (the first glycine)